ncbi:MAG: class I poly(R)-hydroxyalkanoic acid synthase [Proteobacteria bacterium]|nr:class I poly(R)-hydroxyalkanoic acid synthase [Pseudomonadota bacterium]
MVQIGERSARVMQEFMARQANNSTPPPTDSTHIAEAFLQMTQKLMQHPAKMMEAGMSLWQDYMKLWQSTTQRFIQGKTAEPVIAPQKGDKRFQDAAWSENALFDYIKQSYLLSARYLQNMARDTDGMDSKAAQKVDFYTRQFVDAMSPSNFLMTNPEVLRRTAETGGENLVKGLENLLADLERGRGQLRIAMTDEKAFAIGQNLANTPGKVIYQNDLMQLIQYDPITPQVKQIPFLIIPPWINKYYILDLGEKKSFVRWLLKQGYTVFMISWVNPDAALAEKSFAHYMLEGPMDAMRQIKEITGENELNILGYCLGGTLLGALLSWLEGKKDSRDVADLPKLNSATFLVSLLDFRDAGEVTVFIDEAQLNQLEDHMNAKGYLEGKTMATSFNMLRANDLIWSFVVNNYLMGKEPFPFDLLYWNGDSTRMPAAMHSFYLREMYQHNRLSKPGAVTLEGVPVDLRNITTPSYFLSTKDDHIAPWRTTYYGAQMFKGPVRFTLSGSGHIAGVVNPPEAKKYNYWTEDGLPKNPDDWFKAATSFDGSWWPEWEKWLAEYSGADVPAREVDAARAIEDAPGSYVRVKAN